MKLQEVAFMVSLIKANYRRRMMYFWSNILVLVIAIAVLYYNYSISNHILAIEANAALGRSFLWILVLSVALFRVFIVYGLSTESTLPWSIKKDQMTALREQVEAKANFEELRCCPVLNEYFEMY